MISLVRTIPLAYYLYSSPGISVSLYLTLLQFLKVPAGVFYFFIFVGNRRDIKEYNLPVPS